MLNKKEVRVIGIPETPEYSTRTFYKLTIEKVEKSRVAETARCFVDIETGEVVRSSYDKDKDKQYKEITYPTGNTEVSEHEEKIYEQELEDLNVGELATYINRTR